MALGSATLVGGIVGADTTPNHVFPAASLSGFLFVCIHNVSDASLVTVSGASGTWTRVGYVDGPKYIGLFHVTGHSTGDQTLTISDAPTVTLSWLYTYDEDTTASDFIEQNASDEAAVDMSYTKDAGEHIIAGGGGDNGSSQVIGGSNTPDMTADTDIYDSFFRTHVGGYEGTATSGDIGWDDGDTVFAVQCGCTVTEAGGGGGGLHPRMTLLGVG